MKTLIACCGIDCENCDARIATATGNEALRIATARKWTAMNGIEIKPEYFDVTSLFYLNSLSGLMGVEGMMGDGGNVLL